MESEENPFILFPEDDDEPPVFLLNNLNLDKRARNGTKCNNVLI